MNHSITPDIFRSLAVALALASALSIPAGAADKTGEMLRRAVKRARPTAEDREIANELLSDWIDTHPDDVYLKHAFIKISKGLPPSKQEIAVLSTHQRRYEHVRAQALARSGGAANPAASGATAAPSRSASRSFRGMGSIAVVGGLGAVVILVGAGWIFLSKRK